MSFISLLRCPGNSNVFHNGHVAACYIIRSCSADTVEFFHLNQHSISPLSRIFPPSSCRILSRRHEVLITLTSDMGMIAHTSHITNPHKELRAFTNTPHTVPHAERTMAALPQGFVHT